MAHGRPDYTSQAEIKGAYAGDLVTVATDANGNLVAVIRGASGVDILVDANGYLSTLLYGLEGANKRAVAVDTSGNIVAAIKGLEGANLRSVAVDSSGRLIAILRGQSGTYVNVGPSGELVSYIKGLSGATMKPVLLDDDGNIIAVMKGDYGGSLSTIALDDQARMLAVLTDPEDVFGNPHYIGAGELAARLGSPFIHDKRGNVLFMDDFENGLGKWTIYGIQTGDAASLATDAARNGMFSAKLHTANAAGAKVSLTRYIAYPMASNYGLAVSYATPHTTHYMLITLYIYLAASYKSAQFKLDFSSNVLQYLDSGGAYQNIATSRKTQAEKHSFNELKMVVDVTNAKYVRAIHNDTEYDLSAVALKSNAAAVAPRLQVEVWSCYDAAGAADTYVDGVIVTDNEPA